MENPRAINRFFFGLLLGLLILSVADAFITHDPHPFLKGLAVLALFVLLCGLAALINVVLFPPIFRLLGRLTGKRRATDSETTDDHAA